MWSYFELYRRRDSDDYSGEVDAWEQVGAWYGKVRPIRGTEKVEAQQIVSTITHKIRGTYADVRPGDRLVAGSRTFSVDAAINIGERSRVLECECSEVVM